ncbi:MAG: response regulator transcription factor [Mycobacteriales bacterium]
MSVLVIEDDPRIVTFLVKGLRAEGYQARVAAQAGQALRQLSEDPESISLVLLDLGLPDMDGQELLVQLRRRRPEIPVIVLTARDATAEKVRSLDAGAHDYVTKPFAFDELLARIRAALRSRTQTVSTELVVGDLRLDLLTKVAWRAGRRIDLAPREWSLLELLMRHPEQVFSRAQILARVWDYDFEPGSNVVDVYIGYLRRKLNSAQLPPLIETVRHAGYRLLGG